MSKPLRAALSDSSGRIYKHPYLAPAGRAGDMIVPLGPGDLIPLPPGSSLTILPGRTALGIDGARQLRPVRRLPGAAGPMHGAAALLPTGYARTLVPATAAGQGADRPLPLFGYTAVAFMGDDLYAAAIKVEPDNTSWDPGNYNTPDLRELVAAARQRSPDNRLLRHLGRCALDYGCFTAQNIFYRRWEGGIPVSPACNARCLGCISKQTSQCCPSPQGRIRFAPAVWEVADIATPHLAGAEDAIISFGQGCEGEPSLMGDLLLQAIGAIRRQTDRGLININTNGSRPDTVVALANQGLGSIRVSLISAQPDLFDSYVRPRSFGLPTVRETIERGAAAGLSVALNYLIFPGVSDREEEADALLQLLRSLPVSSVQLRNLNIDPDLYLASLPRRRGRLLGIGGLYRLLQEELPAVALGSFTRGFVD